MKFIVTTTINPVTPALELFASLSDWHLIVVTDVSTPRIDLPEATVLGVEDQAKLDPLLSDLIGWRTIQRRNLGYLLAYRMGATIVATVDDDNLPLPGWGENVRVGLPTTARVFTSDTTEWFDPLAVTSQRHLWHRGFPLPDLGLRTYREIGEETFVPDVEASLWLGDPDVDAICRMEHAPEVDDYGTTFPITSPLWGPFNSQNTFLSRAALREYYCPADVGRFDDIWASYHVQAQGFRVIWSAPSVRQVRNDHDLLVDLEHETWGYRWTPPMLKALKADRNGMAPFLSKRSREIQRAWNAHIRRVDLQAGSDYAS